MKILSVYDAAFAPYGKVLKGFDVAELMEKMQDTPCPDGATYYTPSDPEMEKLKVFEELRDQGFGGMPIEIGYCNGENYTMNCLEYHRDSEINLACDDLIMLYGKEGDIDFENYEYDTAKVEAFLCPKGTMIECYATTLHYAPVSAGKGKKFRCVVVLPRGTNTELKFKPDADKEARLLTATNKWLLAHAEAPEAKNGAVVALKGENITIKY